MDVDTLKNNPKTRQYEKFINEMREVIMRYGPKPTEVHVSPNDTFLRQFKTLMGMRVVHNHTIKEGHVALL